MADTSKKKGFPWKKLLVLTTAAIVVAFGLLYFFPRTNRSFKGTAGNSIDLKDVSQTDISTQNIRNVVLISIDTLRADHLSCYGYSKKTSPYIDAIAEEGILFNHAIAPVPLTLPSHSSMLTGTTPPHHKVRDNNNYKLAGSNITLAEILKENGFATGAFIGAFVLSSQFGIAQGFDTYNEDLNIEENSPLLYNTRDAEQITPLANKWLDEYKDQKFFLFLHYFDVHAPYKRHGLLTLPLTKSHYDSEIVYTDNYIGKVIDKLKELNLYDSTLLIITADHGEGLRDKLEKTHSFFIYHNTVHVPLIFKVPGGPKAIVINDVVGLVDIVPTVCGFLGIDMTWPVQGKDLSVYFSKGATSEKDTERFLYCESLIPTKFDFGPWLGMVSNRYKYIHSPNPELYDLIEDPYETKNLTDKLPEETRIMQKQIDLVLQSSNAAAVASGRTVMDDETRKRLESLGYIASRAVDETATTKTSRINVGPEELIKFYTSYEKMTALMVTKKYDKSKKLCYEMLKKWPYIKQIHYYLGKIAAFEKDDQATIEHFSRYLEEEKATSGEADEFQARPDYAYIHGNLGVALGNMGKTEQAIEHYKKALAYNPNKAKGNYNLAGAYRKQGKIEEAIKYYNKALTLDHDMPEAHTMMGLILFEQGRFAKAVKYLNKALAISPDSERAKDILTQTLAQKKKVEGTIVFWLESLRNKPNQPELHHKMAVYFHRQDNFEKAIYHWEKGLEFKPDWPDVLSRLAKVKASHPDTRFYDPAEAVKRAKRACELTEYKNALMLDALSISYAATGKFDEAVRTAEKALELAHQAKWHKSAAKIMEHLQLFRAGQPYQYND